MKLSEYIKDNRVALLTSVIGAAFFSILLLFWDVGSSEIVLLWTCFFLLLLFTILYNYLKQRKRIHYLLSLLNSLDHKYLLTEIADKSESTIEQVYFRLMKTALKDMNDEVASSKRMTQEYRDFVEQWVHEIKVPLTCIQLICENNKTNITREIITQAEILEREVEKVLFYARLGSVEKDYFIKYIFLKDCISNVLAQNKQLLIQNGVCVQMEDVKDAVYSDSKWIEFIINQIVINSIKYQSNSPLIITIYSKDLGDYVVLSLTDNGIGIQKDELNRVFDKGFIGSNGRNRKHATGMGLYICAKLCDKLGIDIDIKSQWKRFTTIELYFPKSKEIS